MRSHLIRDLNLKGADLLLGSVPNANCYNLREITGLQWASEDEGGWLLLNMSYQGQELASIPVTICCRGVQQLILPVLAPNFYISELEIEDLSSSQLENIRFRLKDYGGNFELDCLDVEIVGVGALGVHDSAKLRNRDLRKA